MFLSSDGSTIIVASDYLVAIYDLNSKQRIIRFTNRENIADIGNYKFAITMSKDRKYIASNHIQICSVKDKIVANIQ
jgi:hypothetical protein